MIVLMSVQTILPRQSNELSMRARGRESKRESERDSTYFELGKVSVVQLHVILVLQHFEASCLSYQAFLFSRSKRLVIHNLLSAKVKSHFSLGLISKNSV